MASEKCEHKDFAAFVEVTRLEDSGRFQADVKVQCNECGLPFRFIGLPTGLDLNGAAVSADACEARLAIAPQGQVLAMVDGAPMGFSARGENAWQQRAEAAEQRERIALKEAQAARERCVQAESDVAKLAAALHKEYQSYRTCYLADGLRPNEDGFIKSCGIDRETFDRLVKGGG